MPCNNLKAVLTVIGIVTVSIQRIDASPIVDLEVYTLVDDSLEYGSGYNLTFFIAVSHGATSTSTAYDVNISSPIQQLSQQRMIIDLSSISFGLTSGDTKRTFDSQIIATYPSLTIEQNSFIMSFSAFLNFSVTRRDAIRSNFTISWHSTAGGSDLSRTTTSFNVMLNRSTNDAPSIYTASTYYIDENMILDLTDIALEDSDFDEESDDGLMSVTITTQNAYVFITNVYRLGLNFDLGNGSQATTLSFTCNYESAVIALSRLRFQSFPDFNGVTNIRITVNDNGNSGVGGSKSITVNPMVIVAPVNDAPIIMGPNTLIILEDTETLLSPFSVNDVDAFETDNLTLTISSDYGNISLSTIGIARTLLTMPSSANQSNVTIIASKSMLTNALASSIVYIPRKDFTLKKDGLDYIRFTCDDRGYNGNGGSKTVTKVVYVEISEVNDSPTVALSNSYSIDEDTNLPIHIIVRDVEVESIDGQYLQVWISVNHGMITLNCTAGLYILAQFDNYITFQGDLTAINLALHPLMYVPTADFYGIDVLHVNVSDFGIEGAGGEQWMNASANLLVQSVNDPPRLDTPTIIRGYESVDIPFIVIVNDPDDDDAMNDLRYSVNISSSSGTVSLSIIDGLEFVIGNGTRDAYVSFFANLTFVNRALSNATFKSNLYINGVHHFLTFTIGDSDKYTTVTIPLDLMEANDAPIIHSPITLTTLEYTNLTVNNIRIEDGDVADTFDGYLRITIEAQRGFLTLASIEGIRFISGDGLINRMILMEAAIDMVNQALFGMVYRPPPFFYGTDRINITVNDTGHSGFGGSKTDFKSVEINVIPVNNGAKLQCPYSIDKTEATFSIISGFVIEDFVDMDPNMTITLSVSHGVLDVDSGGMGYTVQSGMSTRTLVLDGPFSQLNMGLSTLKYTGDTAFNIACCGEDILNFTATYNGTLQWCTTPIALAQLNDAPIISVPNVIEALEDTPCSLGAVNVSDPDFGELYGEYHTLTITSTHGMCRLESNVLQAHGVSIVNGSGDGDRVISIIGSIEVIQSILHNITYMGDLDFVGIDNLTLTVSDHGHSGTGGSKTKLMPLIVNVSNVNDPPIVLYESLLPIVNEDVPTRMQFNISDIDSGSSGNFTATVTSTQGALLGLDRNQFDFERFWISNGDSTSTLVVHGPLSPLGMSISIIYQSHPNWNSKMHGNDSLLIHVADFQGASDPFIIYVHVIAINDAPVVSTLSSHICIEDTFCHLSIMLDDVDLQEIEGAAIDVSLTLNNGILSLSTLIGIYIIDGTGTGDKYLRFSGSQSSVNAALNNLTILFGNDFFGNDVLMVNVSDQGNSGEGGIQWSNVTIPIIVTSLNDRPVLTVNPSSPITILEDQRSSINVTLYDVDGSGGATYNITVSGANISISFEGDLNGLTFITPGNGQNRSNHQFQATYDAAVLALSSMSIITIGHWNGVYGSLSVTVNDGGSSGIGGAQESTLTTYVFGTAMNDAPDVEFPCSLIAYEDQVYEITTIHIGDVDVEETPSSEFLIYMRVYNGTLTLPLLEGLTFLTGSGVNDSVLEFYVDPRIINRVFERIFYQGTFNWNGADSLYIRANDTGNSGIGGPKLANNECVLTVLPVDDPVSITMPDQGYEGYEDITFQLDSINLTDWDNRSTSSFINVTLTVSRGSINVLTLETIAYFIPDLNTNRTIRMFGSVSDISAALENVQYTSDLNVNGFDYIVVTTDYDGVNATQSRRVTVLKVNDAPQLHIPYGSSEVNEDTPLVISGIRIHDVDAEEDRMHLLTMQIKAATGRLTLHSTGGLRMIVGSGYAGDNELSFTGPLEAINTALSRLVYEPFAEWSGTDNITFTVMDNGFTGEVGSFTLQDHANLTIVVHPINDIPVISFPVELSTNEDTPLRLIGITASDADAHVSFECFIRAQGGTIDLQNGAINEINVKALSFSSNLTYINMILDGEIYFTPDPNLNGDAAVYISVSDMTDAAYETIPIYVRAQNDAPVILLANHTFSVATSSAINLHGVSVSDVDILDSEGSLFYLEIVMDHGAVSFTGNDSNDDIASNTAVLVNSDGSQNPSSSFTAFVLPAWMETIWSKFRFHAPHDWNGTANVAISVSDLGNYGEGGVKISSANLQVFVFLAPFQPTLAVPSMTTTTEETRVFITGFDISDSDYSGGNITVEMTALHGTLSFLDVCGFMEPIWYSIGDDVLDTHLMVIGSLFSVNTCIRNISYLPQANYNGFHSEEVHFIVHPDTEAWVGINVTAVNDGPAITCPQSWTGLVNSTNIPLTGVSIEDVDLQETFAAQLRVNLTVTNGTLSLLEFHGVDYIVGSGADDSTLSFLATLEQCNAVLSNTSLSYTPSSRLHCSSIADTFTISVEDLGSSGAGGAMRAERTSTIMLACP